MIVGRIFGWLLFVCGLAVLARDGLAWLYTGSWAPLALGRLWSEFDPTGFALAQGFVERHIWSFLWNPVITDILLGWAFAVLMIAGLLLVFLFGRRDRRWL